MEENNKNPLQRKGLKEPRRCRGNKEAKERFENGIFDRQGGESGGGKAVRG